MGVADTIMTQKQGVVNLIWQNGILSLKLNPTVYINYETTSQFIKATLLAKLSAWVWPTLSQICLCALL
jgi:hypothetical protein